jgi:hypothetical protein
VTEAHGELDTTRGSWVVAGRVEVGGVADVAATIVRDCFARYSRRQAQSDVEPPAD